MNIIYITNFY